MSSVSGRGFAWWLMVSALAGCATGPILKKGAEISEKQLDFAWSKGAYRCNPAQLAKAEAELAFVRAEVEQGNPVRAGRHLTTARQAVSAVVEGAKTCPPLVTDRDGDTVFDDIDQCPDDPEDLDGNEDEDGCPEAEDQDGDTVMDPDDGCPETPGPVENQGCPYGDQDGDGLTDNVDECPKAPEDVDSFEDEDGCPDPDNDKDGILDERDRCPLAPETVNNFEDEDGCPDVKTNLVRVNRDLGKIEIKQKVFFSTGRARIRRRSYPLLQEVAAVLKANPSMMVVVEGHTDSVGSSTTNLRLSQRRADAVRTFLVERGIEADRLTAIGFGEEKPIDSNRTRRGRERNRRVDFTITAE